MGLDEITPHLFKIATLYLKNQKRKVGWLYIDMEARSNGIPLTEVFFLSVQKGKKYLDAINNRDHAALISSSETIPFEMIERIRSSK
jgi:ABC-type uncharacterized transport system substrate-binding protein